jgi:hypothetical protein
MNSQPNSHTHCQAAQANAQTKAWQRVCLSHAHKIELKKSSFPSENKKYATAQTGTTKTVKLSIDNGLQGRTTRTTGYNSTYPKGGVSCSKDSFVVNQTLVFQIKFCSKGPALRVAAKRYASFY